MITDGYELTTKTRVLVVIASYGEKNMNSLRSIISRYRAMPFAVDVVVASDKEKANLAVQQVIGTPSRNPFSLPFAHQRVFASRVDQYDLFIYSEDDIGVTEANLRAFARVAKILGPDDVPGFVRYEEGPHGISFPDFHGRFHWLPASVRRYGEYLTAQFTNDHAGFYVITNQQLRRALDSKRFVAEPYEGKYEMLESAATHIYVNCGLRRVLCVSHLDEFMIHHIPNRYAGKLGIPLTILEQQVSGLSEIDAGRLPASTLCEVDSAVDECNLSKRYDEQISSAVLALLPSAPCDCLSVGAGSGALEVELARRGFRVTALPLDSVVGSVIARSGTEVIYGHFGDCLSHLGNRRFDCVVSTNLAHLQREPLGFILRSANLLRPGGYLLLEGPNLTRLPKYLIRATSARATGQVCSPTHISRALVSAGLRVESRQWDTGTARDRWGVRQQIGRLFSPRWTMCAKKSGRIRAPVDPEGQRALAAQRSDLGERVS
jgi:2-polyprenyl-3-methyl-5-hydroxy-6-metoxy-1,4-benzoquinol methylase